MRIDIISCVPNLLDSFFAHSILKRAQEGKYVEVVVHDLRDYSGNKHRSIDDYAFGGGAGMVLQIEPIARCIRALQAERSYDEIIYLTPDGELMKQQMVNQLSLKGNLIMLCGHYKGPASPGYFYYQRDQYRRLCFIGGRTGCRGVVRCDHTLASRRAER
jgi:tRNA (guanine37-N1)-methyltransferase